jgi:hypothetical protein
MAQMAPSNRILPRLTPKHSFHHYCRFSPTVGKRKAGLESVGRAGKRFIAVSFLAEAFAKTDRARFKTAIKSGFFHWHGHCLSKQG